MSNQGTIYVKVDLDTNDFNKGLQSARSNAESSGGFIKNAFAFAAGGAILGGLKAVSGGVIGIAKSMIESNATFETYQTQFGVLLKSTDKAKERLADLAKFGASTPFELDEIVKADKVLTTFGIHSDKTLTMVGDSAAASGMKFEDMAMIYAKLSTGSGEAVARIKETGLATQAEMESWGVKFSKSGQMLGDAATNYALITEGIAKKNHGMMDAQSKTFEGMVSNLQDWVANTKRIIGAPIFDAVKDQLGGLLTFLNSPEVMAALNSFAATLATSIKSGIEFISGVIKAAIPIFTTVTSVVSSFLSAFDNTAGMINFIMTANNLLPPALADAITLAAVAIKENVLPVIEVIRSFFGAFENDRGLVNFIITAYQILPPELAQRIIQATIAIRDGIVSFVSDVEAAFSDGGIAAAIKVVIDKLAEFSPIVALVKQIVQDAFPAIQSIITSVMEIIAGVVSDNGSQVFTDIIGIWTRIHATIQPIIAAISSVVTTIFNVIAEFLKANGDDIQAFIGATWKQIVQIINIALDLINATVVPILTAVAKFISDNQDTILAILTNTWNSIKAVIDAALTIIKGVLTAALQIIQGDWSGAWETIKGMSARVVEDLWTVIKGGFDNILRLLGTSLDDMIAVFSNLPSEMQKVGDNLVEGIKSGIRNNWSSFVNWVTSQLSGLKDEILSFFGIHSPSQVMADEVGQPIVLGILQGMEDAFPALINAFSELGDDLVDKAQSIADKVASLVSSIFESGLSGGISLDRERAKAIDDLQKFQEDTNKALENKDLSSSQKELLQNNAGVLQRQMAELTAQANKMAETDPEKAAAFFKMHKAQLFELAKLQSDMALATSSEERQRIIAKMRLVEDAQKKEAELFEHQQDEQDKRQQSQLDKLTQAFSDLISKLDLSGASQPLIDSINALIRMFNSLGNSSLIQIPAPMGTNTGPGSTTFKSGTQPGNTIINVYVREAAQIPQELQALRRINVYT